MPLPILPANSATAASGREEGVFGFGYYPPLSSTQLVSNTGVVASDVAGAGTVRRYLAACEYSEDLAIFGFGRDTPTHNVQYTNLVSNTGVVSANQAATTGSARSYISACSFGPNDAKEGIFRGGTLMPSYVTVATTNIVDTSGVVASDVTGVGTITYGAAGCEYGDDKGIFGFGWRVPAPQQAMNCTNLVSNTGVVASDQATATGTARYVLAACSFGGDKGIFGFGSGPSNITNIVSNTGVVQADVSGVGTARNVISACEYGGDKGIFGFGTGSNATNLVSNTGVVASDQAAATGPNRDGAAACSFN
jgi:hypothetical protein